MRFSSVIQVAVLALVVTSHGEAKSSKDNGPEQLLPSSFADQSNEGASAKAPRNWLHLANSSFLGGGSRDLLINLDTGVVVDRLRGMVTPKDQSPAWNETKGQISHEALSKLKKTIRMSLTVGLESDQCKRDSEAAQRLGQYFVPTPAFDGVSELSVSLDGVTSRAPQLSCQSETVDDIWRVALESVQVMDKATQSDSPK